MHLDGMVERHARSPLASHHGETYAKRCIYLDVSRFFSRCLRFDGLFELAGSAGVRPLPSGPGCIRKEPGIRRGKLAAAARQGLANADRSTRRALPKAAASLR